MPVPHRTASGAFDCSGRFATAIDAGAPDNLMPDVMKVGGVTGWMRVAAMAQANGLTERRSTVPIDWVLSREDEHVAVNRGGAAAGVRVVRHLCSAGGPGRGRH
nr:enolase C-terminal domain-like protein [Paraburkholderia sp. BL10I2N1]